MTRDTTALPAASADIRILRHDLVQARDEQISRVVDMVDRMPVRGEADALIAPLRERLAQLRPRRRLSFGRLLFLPMNAVIVPAAKWRRDTLAIPRTALAPMIRQVHAARPEMAAAVDDLLAGASAEDREPVLRTGQVLWPEAAHFLSSAPVPPDWDSATGLALGDQRAIVRLVVMMLSEAVAIEKLVVAGTEVDEAVLEPMLARAAVLGGEALGVLLTALVARLSGVARLVSLASNLASGPGGVAGRAIAEQAVDTVLDRIESVVPTRLDKPLPLGELRHAVHLLGELQDQVRDRPGRAGRIHAIRQQMDAACRQRFEASLRDDIMPRLDAAPGCDAGVVAGLEESARELRRFEGIARRLNNSDQYDRMLRSAAALLAPRDEDDRMARMDRLRLTEILLGPERAFALLAAKPPEAAAQARR